MFALCEDAPALACQNYYLELFRISQNLLLVALVVFITLALIRYSWRKKK